MRYGAVLLKALDFASALALEAPKESSGFLAQSMRRLLREDHHGHWLSNLLAIGRLEVEHGSKGTKHTARKAEG